MIKGKILEEVKIKDYDKDTQFCVYGLFDTHKVEWKYYVTSIKNGCLTNDLKYIDSGTFSEYNIAKNCKEFKSVDEAYGYLNNFKEKWESGSNDLKSVIRGKKLDELNV